MRKRALAPLFRLCDSSEPFFRLPTFSSTQPSTSYVSASMQPGQWRLLRNLSSSSRPNLSNGTVFRFPLAQPGEGISECEMVAWMVKEGERVAPYQILCQMQSDKATFDVTAPRGGLVRKLYCEVRQV